VVQDGKVLANKRGDNTPPAILRATKGPQKQVKGLNLANTFARRFAARRSEHLARAGYPDPTFFGSTAWQK